ncbi:MAG: hypothetical protein LBD28_02520 [Tannerellaceae bacterium]|jgi:ligand-binding sensor domain-containing protein|nr:hypothetical protein [Tannerellaceae bacterium]
MKQALILLLIALGMQPSTLMAQRAGAWKSYLSYHNATCVAEGKQYVYAIGNGSLFSYGKEDNSLRYYSAEIGLNDHQIAAIGYHPSEECLVIAYNNGNIDLLGENNSIYNIPYLMSNAAVQDKSVRAIYPNGNLAWLSTAFGVMAINVQKREVKETCFLGASVSSVVIQDQQIFAATTRGLLRASLSDNLIDPARWQSVSIDIPGASPGDSLRQVCLFGGELCLLIKNKGIYRYNGQRTQLLLSHATLRAIKTENDRLIAFSAAGELYIYSSFAEFDKGNVPGIADVSSLSDNTTFWIAAAASGLTAIQRTGSNSYQTIQSNLGNEGPRYNWAAFLSIHKRKLYVAAGDRWTDRFNRPAAVMTYDLDSLKWSSLTPPLPGQDATSVAIDPDDDNHSFVSSWGEGVFELQNGSIAAHYNHTNSALATIFPPSPNYIRVEGLTFDSNKNLWMTNTEVAAAIVVRKADGSWASLAYDDIANAKLADKILIASNGHKWVNLVRSTKSGIFVFDDNGTIDNLADDRFHYYSSLYDNSGDIGAREYPCIAEDRKGEIWIGTNRGPVYIPVPSQGIEGSMTCRRIIHTDEYGLLDYFLKDERVNAIAVDGGNRKWLGTESSGIYLVSDDGSQILHHFTTDNSPLLANRIQSIAIDHSSGEVFIGTERGLISYMGDATAGSDSYSNVRAYPNPVRPGFDGRVMITGLMDNSLIKIVDARGSLVFSGRSTGGQIGWDCRNRSGRTVAPGVYIVLAAREGGSETLVTKIAVVN